MRELQQSAPTGERQVSPLRTRLKRPTTYLFVLCALLVLSVGDSFRSPANQVTGRLYVGAVHVYQHIGRPMLEGRVKCRFQPTCSDYSIGAVQKHGIRHGLLLTAKRINACTTEVPMGTTDPVPSVVP